MPQEQRTLEIQARLRDFVSKNAKAMLGAVQRFAKGAIGAFTGLISKVTNLKNIFLGFFLVLAARRAFQGLKQVADDLDNIIKTSEKVNATTDSLQELKFVAELNAVNFESFTGGLAIFSKNLETARRGSEEMRVAFNRLGISMDNLPLGPNGKVDLIELLARTADATKQLENGTVALAAAQTVFGRQGRELGVILSLQGDEIRKLAAEARARGFVIDEEGLKRAADFNDALARLSTSIQAIKFQLFVEIAPKLAAVFERAANLISKNRDAILQTLFDLGRGILQFFETVIRGVIGLIKKFEEFFGSALDPKKLGAQIRSIENEMKNLEMAGDGAGAAFDRLRRRRDELQEQLRAGGLGVFFEQEFDALLADLDKLQKEFAEAWDTEPVEKANREVENLQEKVTGDFWGGFTTGVEQAWEGLTDLTKAGQEFGTRVVDGILDGLSNALSDIILGVKSAKEAFKDFAKQVINDLTRMIVKLLVVQTLSSFLPGGGGGTGFFAQGGVVSGKVIPFEKFARGGTVSRPTMALFGEAGAEAFVPLAHGKIPVAFRGNRDMGGVVLNMTVNAVDAQGVDDLLVRRKETIAGIVTNAIRNNIPLRDAVGAA